MKAGKGWLGVGRPQVAMHLQLLSYLVLFISHGIRNALVTVQCIMVTLVSDFNSYVHVYDATVGFFGCRSCGIYLASK